MSSINFALVEGCILVSGVRNCAVYDTNTGKVYSINENGKQLLQATLNGVHATDNQSIAFLDKLIELDIGELVSEANQRRPPPRPP